MNLFKKNIRRKTIGTNSKIHKTAIINKNVVIGANVIIHPYVIIESGITIGDGVEILPFSYIGKEPKATPAITRLPIFKRSLIIEENCSIGANTIIYYDVIIGQNTLVGDGTSIREQTKIGANCVIARNVAINYNTQIGHRTKIMDLCQIAGNCNIGNNVFISANVGTATDNKVTSQRIYGDHCQGPIIEDDVTIGLGAKLLPAVRIGKGAFVGAGSLVTKNVAPYSVVMGIPARFVRYVKDV